MAIQVRRGLRANLDTSKLVAGEIAVSLDTGEVSVKCTNKTVELASKEDVAEKQDTLVIGSDGFINLD